MRIAITGSSGLIGTALVRELADAGHDVTRVIRPGTRMERGPSAVVWDPAAGEIDAAGLERHDAVIHLAGESVAGWWTERKKARIRESRVQGTLLLARTLAALRRPPRALLSASAAGYYGNRPPAEPVDEGSPPGTGFLAEVAVAWEAATRPAEEAGIRVAHLRTGVVLSGRGGALAVMLPFFRLGLGGRIGSGEQILSWIALSDATRAIRHLLENDASAGPFNLTAPDAVANAEFVRTLGRVLRRPTILAIPSFALRFLGEMAEEMLLSGARVVPQRLRESGFRFAFPELEGALRHELGRAAP